MGCTCSLTTARPGKPSWVRRNHAIAEPEWQPKGIQPFTLVFFPQAAGSWSLADCGAPTVVNVLPCEVIRANVAMPWESADTVPATTVPLQVHTVLRPTGTWCNPSCRLVLLRTAAQLLGLGGTRTVTVPLYPVSRDGSWNSRPGPRGGSERSINRPRHSGYGSAETTMDSGSPLDQIEPAAEHRSDVALQRSDAERVVLYATSAGTAAVPYGRPVAVQGRPARTVPVWERYTEKPALIIN